MCSATGAASIQTLLEGPDSRRTAAPPPQRDQDEQCGRATRSEVNDQQGTEKRDTASKWVGSLQEQSETRRRLNDAHVAVWTVERLREGAASKSHG